MLAETMDEDQCIIISTHQVKDLENLIDRVTIIEEGKILFNEKVMDITQKLAFRFTYNPADVAIALYSESALSGNIVVMPNNKEEESKLDLELLYKAIVTSGDKITKLFQP